jgi:hypothetical protein
MGEARRKREARPQRMIQAAYYNMSDLLVAMHVALAGRQLDADGSAGLQMAISLYGRMMDSDKPTMLCMTCDHEFPRGTAPAAICCVQALDGGEAVASPVCGRCASASDEVKLARALATMRKLYRDPDMQMLPVGHA